MIYSFLFMFCLYHVRFPSHRLPKLKLDVVAAVVVAV